MWGSECACNDLLSLPVKNSARGPVQTEAATGASIIHARDSAGGSVKGESGNASPAVAARLCDWQAGNVLGQPDALPLRFNFKDKNNKKKEKKERRTFSDVAEDSKDCKEMAAV